MKTHHTKDKGDLGSLKVAADIAEQGYLVLFPASEHQHFDLVAYRDGEFIRVQVKYRALVDGRVEIPLRGGYPSNSGYVRNEIKEDEIDIFAVYCPDTDTCYYVPSHKITANKSKTMYLRLEPPKNNQKRGVHLAEDYLEL